MTRILTAEQMRAADARSIASGTPSQVLMERAARAALDVLWSEFDTTRVLFLCGAGNNGGDGLAMARFFAEVTGSADVCYLGPLADDGRPDTERMSEECRRQYHLLPRSVTVSSSLALTGVTAVVDAILGIGLSRPVTDTLGEAIRTVNELDIPVLALDIPSGVLSDTGGIAGTAIRAAHTVCMAARKFGHLLYPGATLCGKLHVADIGVAVKDTGAHLLQREDLDSLLPRPARAHKGTFGRVLVIGGSVGMSGAGYLCAKAAYRSGAGLVEILAPVQNREIYQISLPEALLTLYDPEAPDEQEILAAIGRADAIVIGMGLGRGERTATLVRLVLTNATVPVVIDADALNEIAANPALMRLLQAFRHPVVLTPHVGEMSRLLGRSIPEIASDLPATASHAAKLFGAAVVLKDARTVICDGERTALCPFGNSGMATGGSGDVLAGVIAAFLAARDPLAAEHGVLAHALAGDAAHERVGSHALMASDILDGLCHVLP